MRLLLVLFFSLFPLTFCLPEIIHVPGQVPSIQQGIDQAQAGDTVLVTEGLYYENINFKAKAITVASTFILDQDTSHISKTIIDGSQSTNPDTASVVLFISGEDSTSVIQGFTLTGGKGTILWVTEGLSGPKIPFRMGSGIYVDSSGCTIKNNIITNNILDQTEDEYGYGVGAGIYIWHWEIKNKKTIIIQGNTINLNKLIAKNNSAGGGIGMCTGSYGKILILNNIISKNEVYISNEWKSQGGGIWCEFPLPTQAKVLITENIIAENKVYAKYSFGGGIGVAYWELGGTVFDYDPNPVISNNIIKNNYSEYKGAGIEIFTVEEGHSAQSIIYPQPFVVNNTFIGNKSADGCGIFNYDSYPFFMNNIFWDDLSAVGSSEIYAGGPGPSGWSAHNGITHLYNNILNDTKWLSIESSVFNVNPFFADTLGHLSAQSPGVGMGRRSLTYENYVYQSPPFDMEGHPRPTLVDTLIDIGAYESDYAAPAYPLSYSFSHTFIPTGTGTIYFNSEIFNYHDQNIQVYSKVYDSNRICQDSLELLDDGQHGDGLAGDDLYGGSFQTDSEDIFTTGLVVKNNDKNIRFEYSHNRKFTTIGPLVYASYQIVTPNDSTINPGETHRFKFVVKNMGQTAVAKNVTAKIIALDTIATVVSPSVLLNFGDIAAGQSVLSSNYRYVKFSTNFQDTIDTVNFKLEMASDGLAFWGDSIFIVGIEHKRKTLPVTYLLKQNYPNPFNPNTTIEFALPKTELVTLRVYNVLGQQVASLVSEKLNPGIYKYQWQPDNLPSGIYYCRMEAGEYEQVRKMVFLK